MTETEPHRPADAPAWLVELYRKVDSLEPDAIVDAFAADGEMRFGSGDPLVGKEAVRAGVTWLCSSYRRMSHRFINVWDLGDTALLEAIVTYDCLDGRTVPVPVVTIIERCGEEVTSLRFYSDPAALRAPT